MFPYIHIYNVNLNICALYTCSRNTKETFLYIIYLDASVSESYIIVPLWKCELYFAENKLSRVSKIKPMITSQ